MVMASLVVILVEHPALPVRRPFPRTWRGAG
jgi:hypothetical protein